MANLKRKILWLLVFVLLLNLVTVQHINKGVAQQSAYTKIYVDPPMSNATVGSLFTINLNIFNATDIISWQVHIKFNREVVNTTKARMVEGDFLYNWFGDNTWTTRSINYEAGYLLFSSFYYPPSSTPPPYPPTGASGDGWLGSITFEVIAAEKGTLLEFGENTKLKKTEGGYPVDVYDFTTEDGLFDNRSPGANAPPVASFTVLPLAPSRRGEASFDALGSYDTDAWLVSYYWDYGDGHNETFMREGVKKLNLTTQATHSYKENGTYTVTLTVADNNGAIATASASVDILFDIAVVDIRSSHIAAMPGTQMTLNVTVANNGYFAEVFNVTTRYSNATFEKVIQTQVSVIVNPQAQKTLTFNWNTANVSLGNYILKANASVLEGEANSGNNEYVDGVITIAGSNIVDYPVVVGGLTFFVRVNSTSGLSVFNFNRIEKKISFNVNGDTGTGGFCNVTVPMELLNVTSPDAWIVRLDGSNVTYTVTTNGSHYFLYFTYMHSVHTVEIIGETVATPPVAVFTSSKTRAFVGELVSFNATASYDPDGTIESWSWDFRDGNIGAGEVVEHTFTAFGTYNVTLTVVDNKQLSNSTKAAVTIIDYPTADFTYSPTESLVNQTILFDAMASQPNGGTITSYAWDFGDGQTGTGATTIHGYSATGIYQVELTVTDSEDLTNSTTKSVTVKIHNIVITSVTATPNTVEIGESVTISLTVANQGNFTESFTVTARYNNTEIETKTVANLAAGNSQTLSITWNTANVGPGTYTIRVRASTVAGETKTDDNTRIDGTVTVEKISSTVDASASPATINLGAATAITGTLNPVRQGVTIMIQHRLVGGTWSTLATATTDAQGQYHYDWTPETPGTYEIQASWQGDANTKSSQSQIQMVTVQAVEGPRTLEYVLFAVALIVLIAVAVYFVRFRRK